MGKPSKKKIANGASVKRSTFDSDDVTIEKGAKVHGVYIKAKKIEIRSGAALTDCKLISDGLVTIGKNTTIKENAVINSFRSIYIGDRTIIDRDVMIGGMQSQKSEIKIGNDCVVLYRSYLNNTRRILIGNNVGIGGYCLIFTHSAWQNVLESNPYRFDDITIKDNVWLPWNVTILPGVTIGKNVTVGTGSVVTKDLPENVFAAGIPAKIIARKKSQNLAKQDKNKIMLEIMGDFNGYLSEFLKQKNHSSKTKTSYEIKTQNERLLYALDLKKTNSSATLVSFRIPNKIKLGSQWIELDTKTSKIKSQLAKDFLMFIKRYGIRIS